MGDKVVTLPVIRVERYGDDMDERQKVETPYNAARRIICEEWHKAVEEFGLTPGSVTEKVVARIINRLDETVWPNDAR